MKKILALTLTGMLVLGGSGAAIAAAASAAPESTPVVQAEVREAEQYNLYLVPGTYVSGGEKIENVISSGATKLTEEQCGEIFTENAYLCSLTSGEELPNPESSRVDSQGNAFVFNGWWTIVDATVTYFETVPELSETTYLYADWRADLSQRKEPVLPDESTTVQPKQYMSIVRAETGETEIVFLYVSGTDVSNACDLGYGAPVQLYNEWFELCPGDVVTVYTVGFGDSDVAQLVPVGGVSITLESSDAENNNTADYLEKNEAQKSVTYIAETSKHYRIYIKFYDEGASMTIYMQPQE